MNTKFTKLISSAAAVLAVGSSAYAQQTKVCPPSAAPSFEQGYGLSNDKFPAAYNAAARIDVQNSWDFYLSGSFIYWYADQEGMDLAHPVIAPESYANGGKMEVQKFEFKPGFKVALGVAFDHDNWVGALEYTWLHERTHKSASAADNTLRLSDWFDSLHGDVAAYSSKWHLHIDLLDGTLSRPFYQGRKLTILPFGGLRAAWIRQNLKIDATTAALVSTMSHNNSRSWAVGPRAGFLGHWLLGCGFRMEGDVAGSVLFTRYTKVTHHEDTALTPYSLHYRDYNTMRPMAEMNVGLGWGSYFDRQNYHFDLLATYDFNILWGQNMMRSLVSTAETHAAFEAADLHLQGLTLTARFDF